MNFFKGFTLTMFIGFVAGVPLYIADTYWGWPTLVSFIVFTGLFALVLGALCAPIFRSPPRRPLVMRIALSSIFGALSGFFWIFFSGPDAHIQFELRFCWMGAAAGVTFIAYSSAGRSLRWMSIVALCAAALTYGGVVYTFFQINHRNTFGCERS